MFVKNDDTVLKIIVGASMCLPSGFKGNSGCNAKTTNPKMNITALNSKSAMAYCFQFWAPVSSKPSIAQKPGSMVFAIHDPGAVAAEKDGQYRRRAKDQDRQKPDLKLRGH